jgi:hypothetical protein
VEIEGVVGGSVLKLLQLVLSLVKQEPEVLFQVLVPYLNAKVKQVLVVLPESVVAEGRGRQSHFLQLIVALQVGHRALLPPQEEGLHPLHEVGHLLALLDELLLSKREYLHRFRLT